MDSAIRTQVVIAQRTKAEAARLKALTLLADGGPVEKPRDVTRFFEDVLKKETSAQMTVTCMFCRKSFTSTGASRLVDHLIECFVCVKEVKDVCVNMRKKTASKRTAKEAQLSILQINSEVHEEVVKAQKTKERQQGIRAGFQETECALADTAVAEFFYANGIPFHVAGNDVVNPYFRKMCDAIRKTPPSWIPPGRNKIGGALIDSCYNGLMSKIKEREEEGGYGEKFGYSYMQDGWDSVDSLPLINSTYFCAGTGGVYLRSVDTSGHSKDAEYIACLMISDIYSLGCTNVVTVVTDTCSTMEKAWGFVMDEFPWISCLPCVPHVVSLMMKDVAKIAEVDTLIKDENTVVTWFSNHQKPLAILRRKVRDILHMSCELVKAGATRFGTHTLVGARLSKLKNALLATVTDAEYVAENYKDKEAVQELSNCGISTREHKGSTARKLVLDEEEGSMWDRISLHVKATWPMYKLLRRHDSSAPTAGKVYHGFFQLGEYIKDECKDVPYQKKLLEIQQERWSYGGAGPFYCAGYMLDPEFMHHRQSTNAEVVQGFNTILERIGILHEVRRLHNEEENKFDDIWKARKALLEKDKKKQRTYEHYPDYPTIQNETVKNFCMQVKEQLSLFRNKKGDFGRDWIVEGAKKLPAHLWWEENGSSTPELQYMAMLVLSQPASASLCERINSEFGFIKDRRRNKLNQEKANKLVSLFHNLRTMLKLKLHHYVEPAVGWCDTDIESGVTRWGIPQYDDA